MSRLVATRTVNAVTVHVLLPGDIVCAERGERLETLLGSCVGVMLTDRHRTVGAMCHVVHASPANDRSEQPQAHADTAIDTMYRLIGARGYTPQLCEAFVCGGGNMFPWLVDGARIGERNAQVVLARLQRDRVRVLFQDLGGAVYRRLRWTIGPALPEVASVAVEILKHD